jgi:uncharacterized protein (TIGR02646 family)
MRYFIRLPLDSTIAAQLSSKSAPKFSLSERERNVIGTTLLSSQKFLCAYCECPIALKKFHIEHFEEQHDAPHRRFDYHNFLLSCEGNKDPAYKPEATRDKIYRRNNISCGHRKTKSGHQSEEIDYTLLLNPTENVAHLFSYFDGEIAPNTPCTDAEKIQVHYTIKRLNLDTIRIKNARIQQIQLLQKQLIGLTQSQQQQFIQFLLDETAERLNPYFSTIKDNFEYLMR